MKNKIIISIIIPCFNAEQYIKKCLNSILRSKFPNYEVIVIDDGSTDNSIKEIQNAKCKIIKNRKNLGPARARNIGGKKARGKYLFFLDIDTQVDPNCLTKIVEKFKEEDKKVGAIQANLGTAGHFLSFFGFPYEIKEEKKERLIFGASTAAMAIRKKLFEKIKGFDEDYLIYGEDTDLSWRVWLAGYKICFLPQAKVHHCHKSSLDPKTEYRLFYEGAKNQTGNIIKNAPLKILFWMLPLHILGWVILSIKLALGKRYRLAAWIYRGLGWNLKNLGHVLRKRKIVSSYPVKNNQCSQIMFGKINLERLCSQGWRWFRYV